MHERLREHAMLAWQELQQGRTNDLPGRLLADDVLLQVLGKEKLAALIQSEANTGLAQQRSLWMAGHIWDVCEVSPDGGGQVGV
jgi:hypothetical protein